MKLLDYLVKYWVIVLVVISGLTQAAVAQYRITQVEQELQSYQTREEAYKTQIHAIQIESAVTSAQLINISESLRNQNDMLQILIKRNQ